MSLETLKPELSALPAERLRSPNIPMATALQEASDLVELCRRSNVHDAMVAVGLPGDFVTDLEGRVDAARQAQSVWVSVRDQTKSGTLIELEAQAAELRSELMAAGRYNLRADPEAQATLSSIRGGETVADLVQDLFDLATVYDGRLDAFGADQSFDAPARVAEARAVAQELSQSISDERLDPQPAGTREMRDRAFTYLDDLVSQIREAGRYVFRRQPEVARHFSSRYRRRQRRAGKAGGPPTEVVEQAAAEEQTGAS
jgi:hypothetical protein